MYTPWVWRYAISLKDSTAKNSFGGYALFCIAPQFFYLKGR
jgi:hypothetical protein